MSCVSLSASLWMGEREGVIMHEGGGSGDIGREGGGEGGRGREREGEGPEEGKAGSRIMHGIDCCYHDSP